MSTPAPPTDSKNASLLTSEEGVEDSPPSYSETSSSKQARVIGDGNVFSDMPRPGMSYSTSHRQAYTSRAERSGSWSFGMFSCFNDPAATFKAWCCPCVSYGQTRHRLHNPSSSTPPVFTAPCMGYCLTLTMIPGAERIFGLLNRGEIKQRLGIDQPPKSVRLRGGAQVASGGVFESSHATMGFMDDALRHVFCVCCALVQEDREVREWARGEEEEEEEEEVRVEGERLLRE